MEVNLNFILTIFRRKIAEVNREYYFRRKRRMRQTDFNILTRCTLFHGILIVVVLLYSTAEFCNASDSSCGLEIPSTTIVRSLRQKCYYFIRDEMYWTAARNFCAKYGARLAKNDDAETNNFLSTALNSITWWQNDGVWIGLHDRNKEFQWEWTTGKTGVDEPVSWTNWASGHPSSAFHNRRNCVRMKRSHGKWLWVDTPCETLRWHYRFICEYEFHEADHSNAAESSDDTKLEGALNENTDENAPTGFYYAGIFLTVLLTLSILICCICNVYIFCQRRKVGHMGAVGIWPFSVFTSRRTVVARAEQNTYVTLEMLAIRKPAKNSSDIGSDMAPQENLYCPMDGSNQRQQHSVYLPMGNASNLLGRRNTMNENSLMDSTNLGYVTPQLSDLYLEPGTIVKRENGDEVMGYEIHQPKDMYVKPGTTMKRENGNEMMGYEIPQPRDMHLEPRTTMKRDNSNEMMVYDIPRPQPVHLEPRTTRMTASDHSTYVEQKNSVQRENIYETIERSVSKSVIENGIPETQNKEMDTYGSAEGNCVRWETEGPSQNPLYSEISDAHIQSGHIYELLDDFNTQFTLQGSPDLKKL